MDGVKICEVVDGCEDCPKYGDDCDGDKMTEHTDLISRADAIDAVRKCVVESELLADWNKAMESAQELLSELPSADAEWIPCSERLPSKDGCYLVSTTGTNNDIIDIAYYTEEIWHKASRIKAWMPLPEPYKAESEEV